MDEINPDIVAQVASRLYNATQHASPPLPNGEHLPGASVLANPEQVSAAARPVPFATPCRSTP